MDMVKRFLEIDVDENGEPKNVFRSENYKLFKNHDLQICKCEQLFSEHFGRYPILYLDFSVFKKVSDFENMLYKLGHIVQRVFLKHNYLVHNSKLWSNPDSKTLFMKFCNGHVILTSHLDVKNAFVFLLELLYKHFKTRVFVLIDDYDAQIQGLLFKNSPYMNRIIIFFDKLIEDLLYCHDDYIQGSMLTGVLRVRERGMRSTGVCHFRFLLDHPFSKFYGITEVELDEIVEKLPLNDKEREETKRTIVERYNGYTVNGQNITLYSVWSVLNFLQNRKTSKINECTANQESFNIFNPFFTIPIIKEEIQKLISQENVWAKIGDAIFNDDIITLNKALTEKSMEHLLSVDLFKVLLYHFGFLSVTNDSFGQSVYRVRIPNKDILLQFSESI